MGRLSRTDTVVCVSAVLLIVSLFMRWWALPDQGWAAQAVDQSGVARSLSGFGTDGVFVPIAGLCAAGALSLVMVGSGSAQCRIWRGRLLPVVGCVPLGIVALEWSSPPDMLPGGSLGSALGDLFGITPTSQVGLHMALASALVLVASVASSEGVLARLRQGVLRAYATSAPGAIWTPALGALAVLLALAGCLTHNWGALAVSIPVAVTSLIVGRSASRRAARGDLDVGYLIRFGQIGGWMVLGTFTGVLALGLIAAGGS